MTVKVEVFFFVAFSIRFAHRRRKLLCLADVNKFCCRIVVSYCFASPIVLHLSLPLNAITKTG